MPEIVIESLDHSRAAVYIGTDGDEASWRQFDEYHRAALRRLENSGAECAVLASNTSHHRFEEIIRGIWIPVINLFEAVAGECARIKARQVLILGTATTMGSTRFRQAFFARGIEAAGPEFQADRDLITALIEELQHEQDKQAAARIGDVVRRCRKQQFMTPPVVCLACTELPLAFPALKSLVTFTFAGITCINTTAAHIAAVFDFAVS